MYSAGGVASAELLSATLGGGNVTAGGVDARNSAYDDAESDDDDQSTRPTNKHVKECSESRHAPHLKQLHTPHSKQLHAPHLKQLHAPHLKQLHLT